MKNAPLEEILTLARQVGQPDSDPMETARSRDWIDANGEITDEGKRLLEALDDEKESHTVLRGNY